jgi:hypothetical protein
MVKTITTTLAVLLLASSVGRADTLLLAGIQMDQQTASSRPKSGVSMTTVESTYGAPSERHAAVGEPPITRWDYPEFSVYFEHDRVIHAVARRGR